ncbi:glycerol proton symporter of the plasma membrane [Saccharomyces cerevisiae]|nr:glycerol proton symporter of the plasma membrane [Saccharomyces cerevisiae]
MIDKMETADPKTSETIKNPNLDWKNHTEQDIETGTTVDTLLVTELVEPTSFISSKWKLYLVYCIVYLCATMQGYDACLMSSLYTMDEYSTYYKLEANSAANASIVFAIYSIGQICASPFIPIMDWLGRRKVIWLGCGLVCIGALVTAVSRDFHTLIGGRWLLSFFTTLVCSAAPAYCVEMAPSKIRGRMTGFYMTLFPLGAFTAAFVSYGTGKGFSGQSNAFKIPLWVQLVFPGIVFLTGWYIQESPRWLVGVGRENEAKAILSNYHFASNTEDPRIDDEILDMKNSFGGKRLSDPLTMLDMRPLFSSRSQIYRFGLVVAIAMIGQCSGNNVMAFFLPTMLYESGIKSASGRVLLNGVFYVVLWVASIIGSLLHDLTGRRKVFLFTTASLSIAMVGLAICSSRYEATHSKGSSSASLFFIYAFGALFTGGINTMFPIYPAEVSSNILRSKSTIVFNVMAPLFQLANQFGAPKALEKISYWFYVFFAFFDLFEFAIVYFFFVETKGRTLEELDIIFDSKNPRKASTDQNFEKLR